MSKVERVFPIYTDVSSDPTTFCKSIDVKVFDYPFFNEGVIDLSNSKIDERNSKLEDFNDTGGDLLELKGFIFHTSHCGSTLLSRMLNVSSDIRMISEPEAINGLLISYLLCKIPEEIIASKIKRIIDAYRQPVGNEKYVILKMTSWNVFMRRLIEKIYPGMKWIYIDRETEEVVQSLMRSYGGMESWWHHPVDQVRKHFIGNNYTCKSKEDYLRRMVQQHRVYAKKYQNKELLSLHYPEFITQFESKILPHFELKFTDQEISHSNEMLTLNAKSMGGEKYIKR